MAPLLSSYIVDCLFQFLSIVKCQRFENVDADRHHVLLQQ